MSAKILSVSTGLILSMPAEGLTKPAIARVLGITDTPGMSATKKVENLLKERR